MDGTLMYMGNVFEGKGEFPRIEVIASKDNGCTWREVGKVPYGGGFIKKAYVEPHMIELPDGTLYGVIRDQSEYDDIGKVFRIIYTVSTDKGKTWTVPKPIGVDGSPPHLVMHSSGVLICTYGFRAFDYVKGKEEGSGQRAVLSYDNGRTWSKPRKISQHIDNWDLGYPCTVELEDENLFTVYYQQESPDHHPGLLYSIWSI